MDPQESLIEQLEAAMAGKNMSRRADTLRRVTELFSAGSGRFSDDQVGLFGDVMSRLARDIELNVRATFGGRLAKLPDAPRNVIRMLAFDSAIEVAGPVLRDSPQLDQATLVECSKSLSNDHLLAVSARAVLTEPVTDVLIDRGDQAVIASLAENRGARFSDQGVNALVAKTGADGDIAAAVWARPDIPRQALVKLFVQASAAVRKRLEAADPRKADLIRAAVASATDALQTTARMGSHESSQAQAEIQALNAAGKLNEAKLADFAEATSFDRVSCALSLMSNLPLGLVERVLVDKQREQVLVIAKAVGLSWTTVKSILAMQAGSGGVAVDDIEQLFKNFAKLQTKTAQTALQFYRLRERAMESAKH
ncbi:DUF2336 domain-containing protein [Bradyrhizobium commune]|uniref:DUF2336 domain-containing protein n=1 Tax=Bradyrhizobium commune TaxID=83627 RepID=A0A7S9H0M8_9BRAD|nr:DUF2336 domain-containing protein [Bradyrhizobium commune]QPF92101.1 DUF2336 domain-containing protein [Bradyrhizobium commune]